TRIGTWGNGHASASFCETALHIFGSQVLQQLHTLWRSPYGAREPVAATERGIRISWGAVDPGKIEPAQELRRRSVLIIGFLLEDAAHHSGVPVPHEFHRNF